MPNYVQTEKKKKSNQLALLTCLCTYLTSYFRSYQVLCTEDNQDVFVGLWAGFWNDACAPGVWQLMCLLQAPGNPTKNKYSTTALQASISFYKLRVTVIPVTSRVRGSDFRFKKIQHRQRIQYNVWHEERVFYKCFLLDLTRWLHNSYSILLYSGHSPRVQCVYVINESKRRKSC